MANKKLLIIWMRSMIKNYIHYNSQISHETWLQFESISKTSLRRPRVYIPLNLMIKKAIISSLNSKNSKLKYDYKW